MNKITRIISLIIILIVSSYSIVMWANIEWLWKDVTKTSDSNTSVQITWTDPNSISSTVEKVWLNLLTKVKYIFSWVLLIFLVYAWAQMIMSMWSDEEALSKSKRTIWYSMIWLVFINMPGSLYEALKWDRTSVAWWISWSWANEISNSSQNLFINLDVFAVTLNDYILKFIQILLVSIAILVIIIAWLRIITARWREEQVTEAKNKILWSVVWLIFVWFIEAWQKFAYAWEISDWKDIFETIANLLLFLAAPIAIFFLTLAWYYYITANWDEDKMKKWKNIVVNVLLWTVILLISYIFLNDLITL